MNYWDVLLITKLPMEIILNVYLTLSYDQLDLIKNIEFI